MRLGKDRQAKEYLDKAVAISPCSVEARRNLAILLNHMRRQDDADAAFQKALEIDPRDAETLYSFGVHLDSTQRSAEAKTLYQRAIDIAPENATIWVGLAHAQRSLGELEDARESSLAALEFAPNLISAINNYGAISLELEDHDAAIPFFERSLAANPQQPSVWRNLAIAYEKTDRPDKARDVLVDAMSVLPDSVDVAKALGHAYLQLGDGENAAKTFERACAAEPDNPMSSQLFAGSLILAGRVDEARRISKDFLARHPGDTTTISCLAMMAAEHGPDEDDRLYNAFDRIIQKVEVPTPDAFADRDAFITCFQDHILNHPTLRDAGAKHATRQGWHTGDLRVSGMGPLVHLKDHVARSLDGYVDFLRQTPELEFLASRRPQQWDLNIWGVAMRDQGHQIAHIHPDAWVSGCFYAKLPPVVSDDDPDREGWIEFGAPTADFVSVGSPKVKAYRPEVGSMFLFPSYLSHRTIPFHSDEVRISIAFDVVPK